MSDSKNMRALTTQSRTRTRIRGQAMTEMVVSFAFVVVPLFLIVPTVGKFIDMKHAAVNSARYAAWERTVYFNADTLDNQPSGFTGVSRANLPLKNNLQITRETNQRIFANADTPIGTTQTNPGRDLWTYHNAGAMYQPGLTERPQLSSNGKTPDKTFGVLSTAAQAVGDVAAVVSNVFAAGSRQFDAINMRGNTDVSVSMSVEALPSYQDMKGNAAPLINVGTDLQMQAQAGVLSQTWSAGGPDHMKHQAQALAPTKLFGDAFNVINIPGIGNGQDVIAGALLTPELGSRHLVFGHMDEDALPRDKFELPSFPDANDAARPLCNNKGYCRE